MSRLLIRLGAALAAVFAAGAALFALVNAGTAGVPHDIDALATETTTSSSSTTWSTSSSTTTITSTTTTSTTVPPKETLVIQGTGDVNLDPRYIPALAEHGYGYAWEALGGLFRDDHLTVINL
ncbi:MAG TPA: hypothetical protein VK969_00755, partial [Acidimicrobiia bacterium]|nr:hypothetical protein [Acidimicrobiia bacterium]